MCKHACVSSKISYQEHTTTGNVALKVCNTNTQLTLSKQVVKETKMQKHM